MKPSFAVFLALVILAVSAVSALPAPYAFADPSADADPTADDGSAEPKPCNRPVPLIYAPVCGSDGKVYSNRYVVDAKNECEGLNIQIVDASNCPEMKDILRPIRISEERIIRRLSRNAEPEPQVEEDGSDADAAEDGQDEVAADEDNELADPADADADADAAADDGDEDINAEDADADADV